MLTWSLHVEWRRSPTFTIDHSPFTIHHSTFNVQRSAFQRSALSTQHRLRILFTFQRAPSGAGAQRHTRPNEHSTRAAGSTSTRKYGICSATPLRARSGVQGDERLCPSRTGAAVFSSRTRSCYGGPGDACVAAKAPLACTAHPDGGVGGRVVRVAGAARADDPAEAASHAGDAARGGRAHRCPPLRPTLRRTRPR